MTVTITGTSGFVGQNLIEYLRDNRCDINKVSLRNLNWRNQIEIKSDALIHLAGKAHDTSNTSSPKDYYIINRDLTITLFGEYLKSDIRDFFYFSSVKAVADSVESVLAEEVEARPLTPYGQSKWEAEEYLMKQEFPEGKRLFIIRPCMIHGPGNKGNLNLLYNVVKSGIPWPLAAFHNERSFLSIDNLNYMIGEMLENESIPSGVYNFADDEFISTNELIEIISSCEDKKARLWPINPKFISGMAKLGDKLKLPLNSERLHKLTENYRVSNDKIKSALGISKLPVTAREGLIKTISSFSE